jgi:hypothetical protein
MPHSYTSNLTHCVWSTKERTKIIDAELRPRLWAFIGGIARQNGWAIFIRPYGTNYSSVYGETKIIPAVASDF